MPALVHLVRHGEVENPSSVSYGRLPGFRLSAEGREQVTTTARYLKAFGGRVELLMASPLERAVESAEIIEAHVGPLDARLDERLIEAGSWRDGLPRALRPLDYARRYFERRAREQVETPETIARRMLDAVVDARRQIGDEAAAVLVSHQQPIGWAKVALQRGLPAFRSLAAQGLSPWIYVRGGCELASVTTFVFEGPSSRPRVRYFSP